MAIAIQQPYFFPYSVYFRLVNQVDTFVFFDDVNFVIKGFIHRNTIPTKSGNVKFTVPLQKASQNKLINEINVHPERFKKWRSDFLQTFYENHKEGPYYDQVDELIKEVTIWSPELGIAELACRSVKKTAEYLGITTRFKKSSELDYEKDKGAVEKILSICDLAGETQYYNLPGGKKLYDDEDFENDTLELNFIPEKSMSFKCYGKLFDGYSIIASMVYKSPEEIKAHLDGNN